jgi:hypothetical protein
VQSAASPGARSEAGHATLDSRPLLPPGRTVTTVPLVTLFKVAVRVADPA